MNGWLWRLRFLYGWIDGRENWSSGVCARLFARDSNLFVLRHVVGLRSVCRNRERRGIGGRGVSERAATLRSRKEREVFRRWRDRKERTSSSLEKLERRRSGVGSEVV